MEELDPTPVGKTASVDPLLFSLSNSVPAPMGVGCRPWEGEGGKEVGGGTATGGAESGNTGALELAVSRCVADEEEGAGGNAVEAEGGGAGNASDVPTALGPENAPPNDCGLLDSGVGREAVGAVVGYERGSDAGGGRFAEVGGGMVVAAWMGEEK